MNDYFVIGSPASKNLAKKIAKKLQTRYLKTTLRVFADGESKLTISGHINNGTIIVVSSMGPPVDSHLIQTLSLISKSREMSSNVIAVVPYMGYAKQDKEFLKGEIVTISVIAKLFKAAGATRLIVVDFHSPKALSFFKLPTKNISVVYLFAEYFKKYKLKNPLVISPDLFWKSNAEKFAKHINATAVAINKQRNRKTGKLVIKPPFPKFSKGQDIIFFDDMVSTGRSILRIIQSLNKENFRKLYVVCTHPVFVGDAEKKIKKAGVAEIIGTNSIEGKFSKIDLSYIISKTILDWK
ncbi:MAG: ribose-phosphate diphosphokinase [Nitrosopumilus sp.]|nr:ribose-phosphate diphosphokinase [Nitrosopumilus sp.]MDH3516995.1 ribose-phosphate diphosphokinase [Nitrosopumilus sp.]MDH3565693.1 ribose-phosphate diphosphokinase [Nitrosopumilus sp.]MDH5416551.1 ribose-phosphate diphosphokinase [Nitrosopumilus sp.]MDH5555151.1 ribose-phosphate diphosphokinase [Nitrosopumilus sp.]